jgi:hypothetical protein
MIQRKRDALVRTIRKEMEQWHTSQPEKDKASIGAYCLWWAYHTVKVLKRAGIDAQLQAGTAYWSIVTPAQDDGVSPNQFGYKFESNSTTMLRLVQGVLPEMHVWAAVAKDSTIIDVTTKYWPERCKLLIGQEWLAPKPPDYLWAKGALPDGAIYQPDVQAIQLAYQILASFDCAL